MFEALLIVGIVVAALACPVMMMLGRRGIGPGCAMMGCSPKKKKGETVDDLRRRERELSARITELEAESVPSPVGARDSQVADTAR